LFYFLRSCYGKENSRNFYCRAVDSNHFSIREFTCSNGQRKTNHECSPSQIEIKIKGGFGGIHAYVKNIGTTYLNNVDETVVLDGPLIFPDSSYIE